ncbi:hypothetical protein FNV43_RR00202 [Rhamnella rubrinervis]|uniref:J domain-containing protein n=1 Tax=Rhamnella rubrinervis TaxID=2594499 RepID=A0A8K0MRP3_9ROSA|nr:hypothetical protein FNV43_RR00202 [Rhamnella rubrinervis]
MDVDHYSILGLPSGEEGAEITEKEISRAYKAKALELHPDKRPHDPNAHSNFQKLKSSYDILKDEKARKLFDHLLKVKQEQLRRQSERDAKRKKMAADLEIERAALLQKLERRKERIARNLKENARTGAMQASKVEANSFNSKTDRYRVRNIYKHCSIYKCTKFAKAREEKENCKES